jgi:hypothetical protein
MNRRLFLSGLQANPISGLNREGNQQESEGARRILCPASVAYTC